MRARSAIISFGTGYKHPDQRTLDNLENSEIDFVYTTNPIQAERKRDEDKMFVEAGGKFTTTAGSDKKPRGTIKVLTYSNIAEVGKEKFIIKFENRKSKTRDYYKDKDFTVLKESLLDTIWGYDKDFADGYGGNVLKINLSESDLRYFLDENGKIKHINPKILSNFFSNYNEDSKGVRNYFMFITLSDDVVEFEIGEYFCYVKLEDVRDFNGNTKSANDFYKKVDKIGTRLVGTSAGFYFDDLSEILDIRGQFKSISNSEVLKSRQEDQRSYGKYFLEVKKPIHNDTAVDVSLWEQEEIVLLKKEYHKGIRTEKDSKDNHVNKVMARRVEYGDNKDRTHSH